MSPWAGSAAFTHRRQETGALHGTRQPLCVSEAKLAAAILPVSGPRGGTPRQHQNDDQRRTPAHLVARVFRRSKFREFPSNSPQCRRDRRREQGGTCAYCGRERRRKISGSPAPLTRSKGPECSRTSGFARGGWRLHAPRWRCPRARVRRRHRVLRPHPFHRRP